MVVLRQQGEEGGSAQLSGPAIWLPLSSQAIRFLMGPSCCFLYVRGKDSQGLLPPCLAPWPQPHKNPAQENETSNRKLRVFVVKPVMLRRIFCSACGQKAGTYWPQEKDRGPEIGQGDFHPL